MRRQYVPLSQAVRSRWDKGIFDGVTEGVPRKRLKANMDRDEVGWGGLFCIPREEVMSNVCPWCRQISCNSIIISRWYAPCAVLQKRPQAVSAPFTRHSYFALSKRSGVQWFSAILYVENSFYPRASLTAGCKEKITVQAIAPRTSILVGRRQRPENKPPFLKMAP